MNRTIPKYIRDALRRRTRAAVSFSENDFVVLYRKHPELYEAIDSPDFSGGIESIVNPHESEKRVIKAIENYLNGEKK